jgi:glycosyltransferase involved in cell wall biosynthesis
MKILELGKFYPPVRGGMETLLELWTEGFAARGHDVTCVVAHRQRESVQEQRGRLTLHRLGSYGELLSMSLCPAYPGASRRHPADLLHAHFPNPLADLAILRAPRRLPVVVHWASDIVRQRAVLWLYRPLQLAMLRRADRVVVATPAHLEYSNALGPFRDKVVVIPYGLDLARYAETPTVKAEAATLRATSPARCVFLNIGRLVGYKGQRYALEAIARTPGAELWLAGTGPLETELKALAGTLGITDRVRFWGNVPDADLPRLLHACDVFLFPSITPNEAFGLVQVEAMACRKPIVACTLKSGVPYVCRHGVNGLTVPAADAGALAEAMGTLIASPELRRTLGDSGHHRAHTEFSVSSMVTQHLELFQALVGSASARQ